MSFDVFRKVTARPKGVLDLLPSQYLELPLTRGRAGQAREIKARRAAEKRERTLRAELTKLQKRLRFLRLIATAQGVRRRAEG